jgi:hypothetical protein
MNTSIMSIYEDINFYNDIFLNTNLKCLELPFLQYHRFIIVKAKIF